MQQRRGEKVHVIDFRLNSNQFFSFSIRFVINRLNLALRCVKCILIDMRVICMSIKLVHVVARE